MANLPHLRVRESEINDFQSPSQSRSPAPPARNRSQQAARVSELLRALDQTIQTIGGRGVIAFEGPGLAAESSRLGDVKDGNVVLAEPDEEVVLVGTQGVFVALNRKVREYRDENTPSGNPKHVQLVARIEQARLATLADLSAGEIVDEAVLNDRDYIVEVWLNSDGSDDSESEWSDLLENTDPESLKVLSRCKGTSFEVCLNGCRCWPRFTGRQKLGCATTRAR
jgi:hypothetical protein